MENIKTVALQAEESVILKVSEVKKHKRNTQKEREWAKEKYHRFTFLIDREKAEKFIELLGDARPLDWFKEQVEQATNTLNVDNANTLNVDNANTLNVDNANTLNVDDTNTLNVDNTNTLNVDDTNNTTVVSNNTTVVNDDTVQKLKSFTTHKDAINYLNEFTFKNLQPIGKIYNIKGRTRIHKENLIEKIIETISKSNNLESVNQN